MTATDETSPAEPPAPVTIDTVERLPLSRSRFIVRIAARWDDERTREVAHAELVVEADGREQRFPSIPQPRRPELDLPGTWSGSFALPSWLMSRLGGHTILMLDDQSVPLPEPTGDPGAAGVPGELGEPGDLPGGGPAGEVSVETVEALRAELRERSAAEATMRGRLADAESRVQAATAAHARLEPIHSELRGELEQLRALVEQQDTRRSELESRAITLAARVESLQDELSSVEGERERDRDRLGSELSHVRGDLARAEVARESALSEAAGLRGELERLGADLATAREQAAERQGGLGEAEAMLAEARAMRTRLLEQQVEAPESHD